MKIPRRRSLKLGLVGGTRVAARDIADGSLVHKRRGSSSEPEGRVLRDELRADTERHFHVP